MKVVKFNESYIKERVDWINNPIVNSQLYIQSPISIFETEKWFQRNIVKANRIDLVFLDQENVVAMTGLTDINTDYGLCEFYIMVNPNLQAKGYGFKATVYTVNHAFINYNINKVFLYSNADNEKANNLYKKVGFRLEGTLKEHRFKNGSFVDRNIFGLTKKQWIKLDLLNQKL